MTAEKTVLLPVSPDQAFALITEPERLRRWKAVSARVDLRAGGEYRFTIIPGHVAAGTYREIEPGRRVVFGWGWEGSEDLAADSSTVTVTLEPTETGTLVRLVHEGLTADQEVSHLEGWNHFFERLERAATTGDAGPDDWAAAPPPVSPRIVATGSSSCAASTSTSAPRSRALARAAGETSTAITRAPRATAIITADSPTPPHPCTATQSPGSTRP